MRLHTVVDVETFFDAMQSPAFVRIGPHVGCLGGKIIETLTPPEEVPGFLEGKAEAIRDLLSIG